MESFGTEVTRDTAEPTFEPRSIFRACTVTTSRSQGDTPAGPFHPTTWLPATSSPNHFAHGLYLLYRNPTEGSCHFPLLRFRVKEDSGQPISYPSLIWEPGPHTPPFTQQPSSGACGNNQGPSTGMEHPLITRSYFPSPNRADLKCDRVCDQHANLPAPPPGKQLGTSPSPTASQRSKTVSQVSHAKSSLTSPTTGVITTVIIPSSQMRRQSHGELNNLPKVTHLLSGRAAFLGPRLAPEPVL